MQLGLLLGLGGIFFAQTGYAAGVEGDPAAGRGKAGQCRTCHGIDGYARIPVAPHIGGEPASYLAAQLEAFRSGERVSEMMSVVARNLSDEDIADLVAWYASQKADASLPAGVSADAAPGPCVACHGANGIATVENAPNLAAESVLYLETQLKAFRSGKRPSEIMSGIAEGLSDEEIRNFAEWYSVVELTIEPAQ
jgi:cytochrome c553